MEENKIDKAIDKSANKIDGALDEVVQSRYVRKFYRWIILPIIAGAIAFVVGLVAAGISFEILDLGSDWAVLTMIVTGFVTFFIALSWLLKRS